MGYRALLNRRCVELFRYSHCNFQIVSRIYSRHLVRVILVDFFRKIGILLHHIQIVVKHGIGIVGIFILLHECNVPIHVGFVAVKEHFQFWGDTIRTGCRRRVFCPAAAIGIRACRVCRLRFCYCYGIYNFCIIAIVFENCFVCCNKLYAQYRVGIFIKKHCSNILEYIPIVATMVLVLRSSQPVSYTDAQT